MPSRVNVKSSSGGGGFETEVVTKTLTSDQNSLSISFSKGKVPKAFILKTTTEPSDRVFGEIYYINVIDRGGTCFLLDLATGREAQGAYENTTSGRTYGGYILTDTSLSLQRPISNSLFVAATYECTFYFWD